MIIDDLEFEKNYVESLRADTVAEIMRITGEGRAKTSYFVDRAIEMGDPAARKRKVLQFCPPPPDQGFFKSPIEYERERQAEGLKIFSNQWLPGPERMAEEARLEAEKRAKSIWLQPSPAFNYDEETARRIYDLINFLRGETGRLYFKLAERQREADNLRRQLAQAEQEAAA